MTMKSAEPGASLISLTDVSVEFTLRRRQRLVAVKDVSLELRRGETLGLIGESGSGKSTLARALVGLAPISSGEVRWQGVPVATMARADRRRYNQAVQMVFQDPHSALDPRRTILQSVREPLDVLGRGQKSDREALEKVGLSDHHAKRYPHELSGGQKQRVNIARALITDPEVLICDESVAALDVALQAEILNLLQDLQEQLHLTMMFISHDLGVVAHIADRICVMYLGEIIEKAPAGTVMHGPLHPYSEALISAEPDIYAFDRQSDDDIVLKGDIPSPISPPSGCRFHTRCPHVEESCKAGVPALIELLPGHESACKRAAELYPERLGTTANSGGNRA
jgi:oligopeptide/dipeptide ABC transporter ATP-binding protein